MSKLAIVILAAGEGKRMQSALPKVLHFLGNKPLLGHVVSTALAVAQQSPYIVYGKEGDRLKQQLTDPAITWIPQEKPLGTGHALSQALPFLKEEQILVLYGDVPLISSDTLTRFIQATPKEAIGLITAILPNPTGYGRIIRDQKHIVNIVEEKETSESERAITEVNSGIYLIPTVYLKKWLPQLTNHNAQQEYYLTDMIRFAKADKIPIHSITPVDYQEILGINDKIQLATLERFYQKKQAEKLMQQGVTLKDPNRFDQRGELIVGKEVEIDIDVIIEGKVIIGNHCKIGPHCVLRNVTLGDHIEIRSHSVIEEALLQNHCIIGPFARIRPGTKLGEHVHVGNFVEIKKSLIHDYSKISHLSYIGDTEMGKKVNIGAGTITCNYDGVNKNRTLIKDNAFIGSNTSLIAPITIGENATIGAGSTLSKDAPANQLTLCRTEQRSIANWKRPAKQVVE